jgi:N-acetylglucosamine-6-sulfatase
MWVGAGAVMALLGSVWFESAKVSAQTTPKPNIIVIMLDDFDAASVPMLAAKGLTPNIKRYLIDEGYSFTKAFSTSTFGSPTRATFLTGQYPHNHGEIGGDPILGSAPRLNESATLATWLRNGGYRTAMIGRYLTGYGWFTTPSYIPPGWDDWFGLIDPTTWSTEKYVFNANGSIIDVGQIAQQAGIEIHQTDMIGYLAGAVIRQAPSFGKPLFAVVSPIVFNRERYPGPTTYNVCPDPSDPVFGGSYWGVAQKPPARFRDTIFGNVTDFPLPQPPSFNEADMSDKPAWAQQNPLLGEFEIDCLQKRYWRKLEALRGIDDLVGSVMTALESTGALNNTVVMFTSDAGDMDGQHRFPEKMPAYDPSLRIPLLMRVPGNTSPRTISRLVLNTDLAPTLTQLGRVTPSITVDGRSLVPLMADPSIRWRFTGLVEHAVYDETSFFGYPPSYLALRSDLPTPRTFVRYPGVTTGLNGELYDLNLDPYQLQNLYTDPARAPEVGFLNLMMNYLRSCRGLGCTLLENVAF